MSRPVVPRRAVLVGLGAGLVAGGAGGCSRRADPARAGAARYRGEYEAMARAAALENQAVSVYRALLASPAGSGSASALAPAPAFARFAETCAREHAEHAATWNAILLAGHEPAVLGVSAGELSPAVRKARSAATVEEAVALALRVEMGAAQAYVHAVGSLSGAPGAAEAARVARVAGVAAAASIAPVEAMHAAILRFMVGEYPIPLSFFPVS